MTLHPRKEEIAENIERNKREGLLCACNDVRVPYYDEEGREHGTRLTDDGILHGYDDCRPWCPHTTDGEHAWGGFKDPDTCAACGSRRMALP